MEDKHLLELIGITYNQIESGVYALILQEVGSDRRLPIVIGFPEAQAIECKLQEVATPRPLTHDSWAASMAAFGVALTEVEIKKLPDGVFAGHLHMSDGDSERIIDARSSDAIALAIRVGAPIYTSEEVLRSSSMRPDSAPGRMGSHTGRPDGNRRGESTGPNLMRLSLKDLERRMDDAVMKEDYEEAGRIKTEMERRKKRQ